MNNTSVLSVAKNRVVWLDVVRFCGHVYGGLLSLRRPF